MTANCILPEFSNEQVRDILRERFDISGTVEKLDGERDLNYLVITDSQRFVFKIANRDESASLMECQAMVLEQLQDSGDGLVFPRCVLSIRGNAVETIKSDTGDFHLCRIVTYIDGQLFSSVNPHSSSLLQSIGESVGILDSKLAGFEHSAIERPLLWNMVDAMDVIDRFCPLIDCPDKTDLIRMYQKRFSQSVLPVSTHLRFGAVHNDANDNNIIVDSAGPWQQKVVSIIDFGDMVYSWIAVEPAIAAAYALLGKDRPLDAMVEVVRGYHRTCPLTEIEISVLFYLVCMRLSMSVCICAHQKSLQPDNEYLSVSETSAWDALEKLSRIHPDYVHYLLRDACGMDPVPCSPDVVDWIQINQANFVSIVDCDLGFDPLLIMDNSVGSPYLQAPSEGFDPNLATREIFRAIEDSGCSAGIGKYDEYRLIYSSDDFVDASGNQRTMHLGIDVFMGAGSAIYAPMEGEIFGIADNNSPLDYGGTIILKHSVIHNGCPLEFYTLYGHLKPSSVFRHQIGNRVKPGQKIAEMGDATENGNWAPHVHFEIITDMLGQTETFVGVGSHAHRNTWLSLCPDPMVLLGLQHNPGMQMISQIQTDPKQIKERILEGRRKYLNPSLSLSYRNPVHMVRADQQYMYDYTGRRFLDSVNNVPHVGHCHPQVARAMAKQARVLNTNTRYLYSQIERYSERLLQTFPDPLSVCYLVNSGSEANDLAMRLANNFTGKEGRVILDHAYHGNIGSLIDISPYKHNSRGGKGAPSHVHTAMIPDLYRGPFGYDDHDSVGGYLNTVTDALVKAERQGGAALFIAESILGCGGQIVLPEKYLEGAYRRVRRAGGVCIADEVQVGFGRVGSHFWAFQTQGVVPDIVTLGKPIGNGHPMAAVITTREIADAFNNGMEYFNTFGGNPVSCAIGNAVLDVIECEGLQQNALETGDYFINELRQLASDYRLIGEVRGLGLFIGIELVNDHDSLDPAGDQADYISERMQQSGILTSTDGPLHNVLKIKPPMCFNKDNVDQYVSTLAMILKEDFARPA